MIPVKLSLKNFMCYRDNVPPLLFDGIHVACLCGNNGNGKSALFDAMTWALWGKSRAKNDDDLVHLGQTEMEVELEFIVKGQHYRVIRKHAKSNLSRAGKSDLQLQVATDSNFRPLTGNSLTETERKIIDILHMDYMTFVNSAFLVQGRADEFSIKQPGQRKEILANILGLAVYDELEKKAKEFARQKEGEAEILRNAIAEIETQLAYKSDYGTEWRVERQELVRLETEVKNYEAILLELRQQKQFLERKEEQLTDIKKALEDTEKEFEFWENRLRRHRSKLDEYEQVISEQTQIEEGYNQFVQAKESDDDFNRRLSKLLNLNEQVRELEKAIEEVAKALSMEHVMTQNRIAEREAKFKKLPQLEARYAHIQEELATLVKVAEDVTEMRYHAQQLLSEIQCLEANNAHLDEELKALEGKMSLLLKSDVRCPLCETELGVEGQAKLRVKWEMEIMDKGEAYRRGKEQIEKKRLEHWSLENTLAKKESSLNKERAEKEAQSRVIEKEIAEAKQAGDELSREKMKLQEIGRRLEEKDYEVESQQKLLGLEREREKLGYDRQRHEYVKEQLLKWQKYDELKHRLEEAKRLIGDERAALVAVDEAITRQHEKIKESRQKQEELVTELAALPEMVDRLTKTDEAYQTSKNREREVRDRVSRLEERLNYCSSLEKSKQEKEKLLGKILNESGIYKELAEAFGKKGIQALLIERALPEIESEANLLLGKMTDNRMSMRLETQRETKKGRTIETLDIKIADELGTRNYEMYSGGESFRIDLALRIALSKLLVRRAGASLPILIIDEGFGTQDSSGREKLIEAINSIQDDFEKILVITHLEEMKDAFPVRINVIKTAVGSTFSLD